MSRRYNQNNSPLERIVYSKVNVKGKVQLVPLELYADGSVKRVIWIKPELTTHSLSVFLEQVVFQ